jgi:hypothetical protein
VSDQTQTLDLAQRIAYALSCTDEPGIPIFEAKEDVETTHLGETPLHLRHLANLLCELGEEEALAQQKFDQAKAKLDKVTAQADSPEGLVLSVQWLHENAECELDAAITSYDVVFRLIFTSLLKHLPQMAQYRRVCIRDDWSVLGEITKPEGLIVENV